MRKYKKIISIVVILGVGSLFLALMINIWFLNKRVTELVEEQKKDSRQLKEYEEQLLNGQASLPEKTERYLEREKQRLTLEDNQQYVQEIENREVNFANAIQQYLGVEEEMAYLRLLSGDFSMAAEEDENMELLAGLYENDSFYKHNGEIWTWVMIDLTDDGIKELFIRMNDVPWTAIVHYEDGKLFCWDIDTVDASGYLQPLENGQLLNIYTSYGGQSGDWENYSVEEFTDQGEKKRLEHYIVLTVDWEEPLDYHKERTKNGDKNLDLPPITEYGTYYIRPEGEPEDRKYVFLNVQEKRRLEEILGKRLEDSEWHSLYQNNIDK